MSEESRKQFGRVFRVNATSGDVTVVGEVDYEVFPVYKLMVAAVDSGADVRLTSEALVVVQVGGSFGGFWVERFGVFLKFFWMFYRFFWSF